MTEFASLRDAGSTAIRVEHHPGRWPFSWAATMWQGNMPVLRSVTVGMTRRGVIRRCVRNFERVPLDEWLPYTEEEL